MRHGVTGDILPANAGETFISLFIMLIGLVFFGLLLGAISASLQVCPVSIISSGFNSHLQFELIVLACRMHRVHMHGLDCSLCTVVCHKQGVVTLAAPQPMPQCSSALMLSVPGQNLSKDARKATLFRQRMESVDK